MPRPTLHALRRRAMRLASALVLAAIAWTAGRSQARAADSVSLEAGTGESKPTPTIPSSAFEYQKLVGRYEPSDVVYLSAQVRAQHDFAAPTPPGTSLTTGPDWVWFFALDGTWDVAKHLTLGANLNGSPPSTRTIASAFRYPVAGRAFDSDAVMLATSSSLGGSIDFLYDTFDEDTPRDVDASLDLTVGYTHFVTEQSMTELDDPTGQPQPVGSFLSACATAPSELCGVVNRAAQQQTGKLSQWRLGATPTMTVGGNTDFALDAAYYVYDKKRPDEVGIWNVGTAGGAGPVASYGAGLPLITPQWALRPEVGHKWTAVSVRLWYQFTDYTIPSYLGHAVGTKVQLYLGKWRPYATASYRADVSTDGSVDNAQTWTVALGLTRQF